MPHTTQENFGGPEKFFLIALAHTSLRNYYKMNFVLMQDHKYTLADIESMVPFEREIYTGLLRQQLEKERLEQGN